MKFLDESKNPVKLEMKEYNRTELLLFDKLTKTHQYQNR